MSTLYYVAQIMRKGHSDPTNMTVAMKNSHGSFTEPNLHRWFTEPTSLSVYQHSTCLLNIATLNINFSFQFYLHLMIGIYMHNFCIIPSKCMSRWFTVLIEFNHVTWQLFAEHTTSNFSYDILLLHIPGCHLVEMFLKRKRDT